MRKFWSVLISLALLVSMAGCGGSSNSGSSNSGGVVTGDFQAHEGLPSGDVHLLVHLQAGNPTVNTEPTEEDSYVLNSPRIVTNVYTSLYPNVTVEFFYNFSGNSATQVEEQSILIAGGVSPDIFFAWGNALLATGWLQTVTEYMEGPNEYEPGNESWKEMYYDYMWGANQMTKDAHGEIVSVPFYCHVPGTIGIFYNKPLFQEYGVEIPTTFQELCDLALMFKENGYTGYAPGGGQIGAGNWDFWSMLSPALAVGYEALDLDGNQIIDVQEDLKAAFEGWYYTENNECVRNLFRLYKYKYAVVHDEGWEDIDYSTAWANGKVAMLEDGLWRLPGEASDTKRPFDYGIFLHPLVNTDTDVTLDGNQIKLDDASKVRVPEMTEAGPDQLELAIAYSLSKPELQNKSQDVLDYCMDYLKFLSATDNLSMMVEEMNGARVGATKSVKTPGVLVEWMSQPFKKALVGGINTQGWGAGDSAAVRGALLEQYVKDMMTEEEFFKAWDQEVYDNLHEYVQEQDFDASGYDEYVPAWVNAHS